METNALELPDATIVHDVRPAESPDVTARALLMIGQPMTADGFATLASYFADRVVVTYDPRGLGRSTRADGSAANDPRLQADDLHQLVTSLGIAPVDLFASSGGAVTALAWTAAHPEDLRTVVAHEPPVFSALPDADRAFAAELDVRDTYHRKGFGHGLATFISLVSWEGEFTDEYRGSAGADPATMGLPAEDDGTRDDPLLSGASAPVTAYEPDVDTLRSTPVRLVIAIGVESINQVPARAATGVAALVGQVPVVFPSHHGGFAGPENGYPGQPEAFAARLREILDDDAV